MNALPAQRFLYVEDSPDQQQLLLEEFRGKRHWNPIDCLGGVQAFRDYLAREDSPSIDVLIVDWRLRDGGGGDVIALARDHPKAKGAAILAVSGVTEEEAVAEADRVGGHYWLQKPLTVDLIKDALTAINGFGEIIVRRPKKV
jgi:DNA-binding response OmpR family regulator